MVYDQGNERNGRLTKLFHAVTTGKQQLRTLNDSKNFLNACTLQCVQNSPGYCVEILLSRADGLNSLRSAVRNGLNHDFIVGSTLPFIAKLSNQDVASLNNGEFLATVVHAIVYPCSFWDALLLAHRNGHILEGNAEAFGWLCLQVAKTHANEDDLVKHFSDLRVVIQSKALLNSPAQEVRSFHHRIEKVLQSRSSNNTKIIQSDLDSPGGRHDNDFADFRQICLLPTNDEVTSKTSPYLQRLNDVFQQSNDLNAQDYLDWLFRLLREDMLAELREDFQAALSPTTKKRKPLILGGLKYVGCDLGVLTRALPCAVKMSCVVGLGFLAKLPQQKRGAWLKDNKSFLKHQSLGVLCNSTDIVAFGTLRRDEDNLLRNPPVLSIQIDNQTALGNAVKYLSQPDTSSLSFIVINTATFAYVPILQQLQKMRELPLDRHLFSLRSDDCDDDGLNLSSKLLALTTRLSKALHSDEAIALPFQLSGESVRVRGAQLESLLNGLTNPLAQIQGPPGTGKSFIGALLARTILEFTNHRILVLSYTNHAVDQFVKDLFDIGVKAEIVVRLGSKSSDATASTKIENYMKDKSYGLKGEEWNIITSMRRDMLDLVGELEAASSSLKRQQPTTKLILDYLEFSENHSHFWDAFQVPQMDDGFVTVTRDQKEMTSEDLYNIWLAEKIPPAFQELVNRMAPDCQLAWEIPFAARHRFHATWIDSVRKEQIAAFVEYAAQHNNLQRRISSIFYEPKRRVLRDKRVIACTTTGAAMFKSIIDSTNPDVVIVEEAGEILEAHVVTALGPLTKQLILIGDHKQLPPKVNNYALSKEKGDGYDLNVSLFERLIRHGNLYSTLRQQHRSHPDISSFARMLAYENLEDMPSTRNRESIRGLESRVVFVHHEHAEESLAGTLEKRDATMKESKKNLFEAKMVLKLVKYLGQQGYKTDNIVILTPYLGQLSLLREILRQENDPYLNDLDSHDLMKAGLMTEAASKLNKKPIRLSTIDNYQGEESDIVIASLTRSNSRGDIGFLSARERLVVLMSRARNGIILFGNMNTFLKSKKGNEIWELYFQSLKEKGFLFDGVPVYCEQHPDRHVLLKNPEDFDLHCPDGGCAEQCDNTLKCGHKCKRRCHRLQDHTKVGCTKILSRMCSRGHDEKIRCGQEAQGCKQCKKEDEETRRRLKRDIELERKRQEAEDKYRKQRQEIEDEMDLLQRQMKYEQEEQDQMKEIKQKQESLKSLKQAKLQAEKMKQQRAKAPAVANTLPVFNTGSSDAASEWQYFKNNEGATNEALDELMGMIGLESVKKEFLSIKTSVDTKLRQGVSLSKERFSCSLLGNPGTGKTTVARIWAKFLVIVGAIPGQAFKETTGSKLASDGVKGCESLLEGIKNEGGGVLFIDEAYQLSSGNSPGGKAVLDFLLAEVENLRGKITFVLAGYSKQMESFFAHNPGFPSRFPIEMKFEDYDDKQLLDIFRLQLHNQFKGRMSVENGSDGLYARIATRRIGYSRGKEGFGNARAVENCLSNILKRQADRLGRERRAKLKPNDLLLTKEDMIGPEPSGSLHKSKGWQALQSMTGLSEVKQTAKVLFDTLKTNYERELEEEPLIELSLNRVFVGNPGTGKTTVAKYYGQILVDLGLLSNGEVVIKNPSDFVGAHLGQSEAQTKGILAATVGKVLVIDEAYGLYGGSGSSGGGPDTNIYNTAVIDTIVAEVQSVPGEDRCVLLLGYQDKMETMFQNVNPGLSRRFPMASAFVFEDFDDDSLMKIFDFKLKKSGFQASDAGKRVALEVLTRARNRPHFGNAGEIDILLDRAKISLQKRVFAGQATYKDIFQAIDFDADYDRVERSGTNIRTLFKGDVGREALIKLLEGYQKRVYDCKQLDMDPEIPFNFLFRGPPGTGKTSTARKIGQVYYDMGFLSTPQVEECSATQLIGEYVGQTGPKVQRLVEKSLGRVLFIDEAYRLSEGHFAKEALDELVDLTTKPKFQNKLIIILAGYVQDINQLISRNPGMTSRFPEVVDFAPLEPTACFKLITKLLEEKKEHLESKGKTLDITCLSKPRSVFRSNVEMKLESLSKQEGWASARDIQTIAKSIFGGLSLNPTNVSVSEIDVVRNINAMYVEREERMRNKLANAPMVQSSGLMQNSVNKAPAASITSANTAATAEESTGEEEEEEEVEATVKPSSRLGIRDAGVSDEVWEQLQRDAAEEDRKEKELQDLKRKEKTASEAQRKILVRQILEEEKRRKQEEARKKKLMEMGRCPMGYNWIKESTGGYRCGGGSHWISGGDVGTL